MTKKYLLAYLLAFALAFIAFGRFSLAQSPTPSTKGGLTPTPTLIPGAPITGLGGGY